MSDNDGWTVNDRDDELDKDSLTLAGIYEQARKLERQHGREIVESVIRLKMLALIDAGVIPNPEGGFRIEWED